MDPRLADRRRTVAEDRARSNLRRLLRLLVVGGLMAAGVWLLQSPFLSVSRVVVTGAVEVDVEAVLSEHQVVAGRPMVLLDTAGAAAALEDDVWVIEAQVARDWPTTVIVTVSERASVATVRLAEGWHLLAADGTVLESVEQPRPATPTASFAAVAAGDAPDDLEVVGAVVFLAALPPGLAAEAVVAPGPDGLEATVAGFTIRLGRPFDMEEKAVVTREILATDLEEGSVVTVFSPAAPAVLPPGAGDLEPEDEVDPADPDPPAPWTRTLNLY